MGFQVGDEVVCVDAAGRHPELKTINLVKGAHYTVTQTGVGPGSVAWVQVAEARHQTERSKKERLMMRCTCGHTYEEHDGPHTLRPCGQCECMYFEEETIATRVMPASGDGHGLSPGYSHAQQSLPTAPDSAPYVAATDGGS